MTLRAALALALLAPAAALAAPAAGAAGGPEVGGFVGYETADFSGPALRLDAELPVRQQWRKVKLSLVGSLGYSRLTWSPGYGVKGTADVVKLAPALRFTVPVATKLSVFGDAGLGVAWVSVKVTLPAAFAAPNVNDSTFNVLLRLGAGAWYHASEQLKLGVLLELDPFFGDFGFRSVAGVSAGSQTTFLALLGGQYRL